MFFIKSKNKFYSKFYSKYMPLLVTHFPHLSGNLWIPRQKNLYLLKQATHQAIYGRLRKNWSAAQRARGPSTKTDGNRKGPSLVNKRHGVAPPSWVSPSSFGPLQMCVLVRCCGEKLACHVFVNNPVFFHSPRRNLTSYWW